MAEDFSSETLEVEPYRYSATWLIGAATHAIDRFEADVERIFQPSRDHVGGTIHFSLSKEPEIIGPIKGGGRKARLKNIVIPPQAIDLKERIIFDCRRDNYFNWSHHVNFFLTVALAAHSRVNAPITVVLPGRMPKIAFDLYKQFGFDVVSTDGVVRGRNFGWQVSHGQVIASYRPQLIAPFMSQHDNDSAVFPSFDLPRRVFISRRGARSLSNEEEIEKLLSDRGFTKLYAEDLSVPQQFALFRQADQVVGIHGAGLAPLEYRSPSKPGFRLIELAPVGIVTRWFGIMCEQVGGKYIAVRGRVKPEYIRGLYAEEFFEEYCNDNFEIDPKSLRVALEMITSV
jgi:hypothetical protein